MLLPLLLPLWRCYENCERNIVERFFMMSVIFLSHLRHPHLMPLPHSHLFLLQLLLPMPVTH